MAEQDQAIGSATESNASGGRGAATVLYTAVSVSATYDPAGDVWTWNPPAPNVVELKVPPDGNPDFVVTITINAVGQTVAQAQLDWSGAQPPRVSENVFVPPPNGPNQLRFGVRNDLTSGQGPQSFGFEVSGTLTNGQPFRSKDPEVVLDPP